MWCVRFFFRWVLLYFLLDGWLLSRLVHHQNAYNNHFKCTSNTHVLFEIRQNNYTRFAYEKYKCDRKRRLPEKDNPEAQCHQSERQMNSRRRRHRLLLLLLCCCDIHSYSYVLCVLCVCCSRSRMNGQSVGVQSKCVRHFTDAFLFDASALHMS